MSKEKEWKELSVEDCPDCGDGLEVLTSAPNGSMYDGDVVQCVDCGLKGVVSACDDEASIIWDEEPINTEDYE